MLLYYFKLHFNILNRRIQSFGMHPILGYISFIIIFIILSIYLNNKTQYFNYIYLLIYSIICIQIQSNDKQKFINQWIPYYQQVIIKLLTNLIIGIPFASFLIYKNAYYFAGIVVLLSSILAFFNFNTFQFNKKIPTPFYKKPFEFIIGFRKSLLLILIAYAVVIIGIIVKNFNLSLVGLILLFIICFNFFFYVESQQHVWIYNKSVNSFLKTKVLTAMLQCIVIITLPILSIIISNVHEITTILIITVIGIIYIPISILMKYAQYPNQISIIHIILWVIGIVFPPFALLLFPYFYFKATQSINTILSNDSN